MSETAGYLPDMIGWNARRPSVDECELVGRETSYAGPRGPGALVVDGDTVIETPSNREAQTHLAAAFEVFGMCDTAYAIPAGVYLVEGRL